MSKGLSSRRRNTPWIHRWSRPILGAIAVLGILNTGYLTLTKLSNTTAVCPTSGCEQVLDGPYATVFGLPLALFGLVAYSSMAILALGPLLVNAESQKSLRNTLEQWTWLFLFIGATAMTVFSGYLMYIMFSKYVVPLGPAGLCAYCIASAISSLILFVVTLIGREWEDLGQLVFVGIVVVMATLVGALAVYAPLEAPPESTTTTQLGPPVTTSSSQAEIELARHLRRSGAKFYAAYWCSHCYEQKILFGQEAVKQLPYVECSPDGLGAPIAKVCQDAGIEGFPTWEINGQRYSGVQSLQKLAELSGYTGPTNFQNKL